MSDRSTLGPRELELERGTGATTRRPGAGRKSRVQERYTGVIPSAVQMKSDAAPVVGSTDVRSVAGKGVEGVAGRLPHAERIQAAFGAHDISATGAHVGGSAIAAIDALGAEAYSTGGQVAFRSQPDLHTAAHEAAHVVQQRSGVQLKGGVGATGDAFEREADQVADLVVRDQSAAPILDKHGAGDSASAAVQLKTAEATAEEFPSCERDPAKDAGSIIAGDPWGMGPTTDEERRRVLVRQIGGRIGGVFSAMNRGLSLAKGTIAKPPPEEEKSWTDNMLELAISAALSGAAGPIGTAVGLLTLRALPNAPRLSDMVARATRVMVKGSVLQAVAGLGVQREDEQVVGLAGITGDPLEQFINKQGLALDTAGQNARDNFIATVEPELFAEEVDYLETLNQVLQGLVGSEAISAAQASSTIREWVNFLARWEHGVLPSGNAHIFKKRYHRGEPTVWAKYHETGVLHVHVKVTGDNANSPEIEVSKIALKGVNDEVKEHLRESIGTIGETRMTTFIRFTAPADEKQASCGHPQHKISRIGGEILRNIDGSVSLAGTNKWAKEWLSFYWGGMYRYVTCLPDTQSGTVPDGATPQRETPEPSALERAQQEVTQILEDYEAEAEAGAHAFFDEIDRYPLDKLS